MNKQNNCFWLCQSQLQMAVSPLPIPRCLHYGSTHDSLSELKDSVTFVLIFLFSLFFSPSIWSVLTVCTHSSHKGLDSSSHAKWKSCDSPHMCSRFLSFFLEHTFSDITDYGLYPHRHKFPSFNTNQNRDHT